MLVVGPKISSMEQSQPIENINAKIVCELDMANVYIIIKYVRKIYFILVGEEQ